MLLSHTSWHCRSVSAQTTSNWQSTAGGDWTDATLWSNGVPVDDTEAIVDNGGVVHILSDVNGPRVTRIGGVGNGTVEVREGSWRRSFLYVGGVENAVGTLRISGGALSDISISPQSQNARIIQDGGTWEEYEMQIVGTYEQTGGLLSLRDELAISGSNQSFLLSGTGQLDALGIGVVSLATLRQTGGVLSTRELSADADGVYRMEGGVAEIQSLRVFGGTVELDGGTLNLGMMTLPLPSNQPQNVGELIVSNGTLTTTSGVMPGSAPLDFRPGPWTLDVRSGMAALFNSRMPDVTGATLRTAANTLTILPPGTRLADFAHLDVQGIVAVSGEPVTIPANVAIRGVGESFDPLIVAGQLTALAAVPEINGRIDLHRGIQVRPGATADLGDGHLTIAGFPSGMEGGTIRADILTVGIPGIPGQFVQNRGQVTKTGAVSNYITIHVGNQIDAVGSYEIQNGSIVGNTVQVGGGGGQGQFRQSGGNVFLYDSLIVGPNGEYDFSGGVLTIRRSYIGAFQRDTADETVSGRLRIGEGEIQLQETWVGAHASSPGILDFTSPLSRLEANGQLRLGPSAVVTALPGATLHLNGGQMTIESNNPANFTGLSNLSLIADFYQSSTPSLEIASQDLGPERDGLVDNFAWWSLTVGENNPTTLALRNDFDNTGAAEALYVRHLVVGENSRIDLNGANLYYETIQLAPSAQILLGGGELIMIVPEPSSLFMAVAVCASLALARRRTT